MHHLFFSLGEGQGPLPKTFPYSLEGHAAPIEAAFEAEAACTAWGQKHFENQILTLRPIFTEAHDAARRADVEARLRSALPQVLNLHCRPIECHSGDLNSAMNAVAEEVALAIRKGDAVSFGLTQGLRPFAVGMTLGFALGLSAQSHQDETQNKSAPRTAKHLGFAAYSIQPNELGPKTESASASNPKATPCEDLAPAFHLLGLALALDAHQRGLGPELLAEEFEALIREKNTQEFQPGQQVATEDNTEGAKRQPQAPWSGTIRSKVLSYLKTRHVAALALAPGAWAKAHDELQSCLATLEVPPNTGMYESISGACRLLLDCLKAPAPLESPEVHLVSKAREEGRIAALVSWAFGPWDAKSPYHQAELEPTSEARWAMRNHVDHMGLGKPCPDDLNDWSQSLDAWLAKHPTHPVAKKSLVTALNTHQGRRIMVASLGRASNYHPLQHQTPSGQALGESPFAFTASTAVLGGPWDAFWVVLPPQDPQNPLFGMWDQLLRLAKEAGLPEPERLEVPEVEGTPWRLFDVLKARLQAGDELHVDLTHGYRKLPLAALMVGAYLQASGLKGRLAGLSYVHMKNAASPDALGKGICLDLSTGLEALALSHALNAWYGWGQGDPLAQWLNVQLAELPQANKAERDAWQALGRALSGLGPALKWAHWGEVDACWAAADAAIQKLETLRASEGLCLTWHRLVLVGLGESLKPFRPSSPPKPIHLDPIRLAELAIFSFQHKDWFTAALLGREAAVAHLAGPRHLSEKHLQAFDEALGREVKRSEKEPDPIKHPDKWNKWHQAQAALSPWPDEWRRPSQEDITFFATMAEARNAIAHLGTKPTPPNKLATLTKALQRLREHIPQPTTAVS